MKKELTLAPSVDHPHHARNLALLSTVEVGWGFGMAMVQAESIVPVFVRELGGDYRWLVALPVLIATASLPFELLSGVVTARLRTKKWLVYAGHCLCPLFTLAIGASFQSGIPEHPLLRLYGLYFFFFAAVGFLYPLWYDFMAAILDPVRRGRAFGAIFTLQTLSGFGGAFVARWLIETRPFPMAYALCFLISSTVALFANQAFLATRETERPAHETPLGLGPLLDVLRTRPLRRYLYVRAVTRLFPIVVTLYAVQATDRNHEARVGDLAVVFLAGKVLMLMIVGRGDRHGFRPFIASGIGLLAIAAVLASTIVHLDLDHLHGAWVWWIVAALAGAYTAVEYSGNANIVLNLAPKGLGAAAIALSNSAVWPLTCAIAWVTGTLANRIGPHHVQAWSAPLLLAAALYLFVAVDEKPAERPGM
jgi:putative Ca2+/H+ antiporter (TMEM165/GDT1 family)